MKIKTFLLASFLVLFSQISWAETCYDFLAGQTILVGSVCISNDDDNLYVKYQTTEEWLLNEAHLFVGKDISQTPTTKKGNPQIGQFPYKQEGINTNYYEFIVPRYSVGAIECGDQIFFTAHASVQKLIGDGTYQEETAWAEGERFVERGNWAMFSDYIISCDPVEPPTIGKCDTAFAFGDTTFIDLGLTNSRWGWEISSLLPGDYSFPIFAGAGQNDINKGVLVGYLVVNYDGSQLAVHYDLLVGFVLDETHLYVGAEHTTTIAPGQYGNIHDLDYSSDDYYTLDGFSGEPLYIVAHAVTCPIQ